MPNFSDISTVKNENLTKHDMLTFISAFIEENGLISHNLEGYKELVEFGINKIMTQLFNINRTISNDRENDSIKSFNIQIKFHNIKIEKPTCTKYIIGKHTDLYPNVARITGLPYSGAIRLFATVILTANYSDGHKDEKVIEIPEFQIGEFPIMIGSIKCNTYKKPLEGLKQLCEDPTDLGGYFIAKRGEYIVDLLENIRYNSIHTHLLMGYKEFVRSEFLSQPGGAFENSSMLTVRYLQNGQITIEINSTVSEKVKLPFYVIYRLLGMTSDKDITSTIVFDIEDKSIITEKMLEILDNAFHLADSNFSELIYELNQKVIVQKIAEKTSKYLASQKNNYNKVDSAIQSINNEMLSTLDDVILPHMGKNKSSRIKKLRFIGLIIHKTLLVYFGILSPIDRDSYKNKRVHGSGISLAKAFKTQTNNNIIMPVLKQIKKELKSTSWDNITAKSVRDMFYSALNTSDLNKAMEQAITSGNKTIVIKRRAATNRVSSQVLERKNILNTLSALRTVVTQNSGNSSKQTERADLMRRVHSTYTGFICVAQSADSGEKVGMRKQLAITATVCVAGETNNLKNLLKDDIIPLESIPDKDIKHLSRVFVNGEWIGCCNNSHELVKKYKNLRRLKQNVESKTTIYLDPVINEVEFWLDIGRLIRPLLIVDNNIEAYDKAIMDVHKNVPGARKIEFVQNIRLTKEHIMKLKNKTMAFYDLIELGIVEYIAPEEQENCLIAESIDELFKNKNNVIMQYTHCDIEQAILGIAALISPYGNHTQPARITHSTNHARQSGGWYALNFPFRTDKNRFFQFYNEIPLIKTFSHNLIPSNGSNVIIAYASYGGNNQEDSVIVCQASVDRGLFNGAFFRYEMIELKKGEIFANPDPAITKNIKPNASYEKLENGLIKKGSVVYYGDIIVGRIAKITKNPNDQYIYQYIDRSIVYRLTEPAIVEDVFKPRNVNEDEFAIVKLRYERPLRTGDKLASRCGNKSIVATMLQQSDMPFTESGLTPDLIINPHSFPTRMTIGQLIETTVGKICARKGVITDGTTFLPIDHHKIIEEMISLGYRYNGLERLYNGMTGEYFDSAMFIGPNLEQRIQKFVLDDEQVVGGSGPTDATTGQPLGGKHVQGGLRIGYMENDCLISHGSMLNMYEKLSTDSDGRVMYVCRNCGNNAVYNEFKEIYNCIICKEYADITAIDSSKTAMLFCEELAAANISIKFGVTPREFD